MAIRNASPYADFENEIEVFHGKSSSEENVTVGQAYSGTASSWDNVEIVSYNHNVGDGHSEMTCLLEGEVDLSSCLIEDEHDIVIKLTVYFVNSQTIILQHLLDL